MKSLISAAADEYQRKLAFEITEARAKRKAPKDAVRIQGRLGKAK